MTHISADEDYAQAVSLDTDGAIFIWDLRTLRPVQELNTRKSIAEACMAGEGSSASRSAASTASAASSSAGGGASDATDHHLQPISALFYDRRGRRVIGGCHHLVEWRSAHKEHHEGARSPRSASPPPHRASPSRPTPLPPSERQQRSMLQRGQKQQQSQPLQPQPSTPSQPFSPPPASPPPASSSTSVSAGSHHQHTVSHTLTKPTAHLRAAHGPPLTRMRYNRVQGVAITGDEAGTLCVWEVATGRQVSVLHACVRGWSGRSTIS